MCITFDIKYMEPFYPENQSGNKGEFLTKNLLKHIILFISNLENPQETVRQGYGLRYMGVEFTSRFQGSSTLRFCHCYICSVSLYRMLT